MTVVPDSVLQGDYLAQVRWLIRRDMPEVVEIENASFEFPWSEDDFIRCLRQRNCIGMVAEVEEVVLGFVIYELHKTRLHILNLAVHPHARRYRIGTVMLDKVIGKLSVQRRRRILTEVRDTNLGAQLFMKANHFRAISVLQDFYEDTADDAYLFEYRLKQPSVQEELNANFYAGG